MIWENNIKNKHAVQFFDGDTLSKKPVDNKIWNNPEIEYFYNDGYVALSGKTSVTDFLAIAERIKDMKEVCEALDD